MQLEAKGHLADVQKAVRLLRRFIQNKSFADYELDALLRSGVERQLEIIGEALNRLAKKDPQTAGQIREYRKIIAFRNVLIHGYDSVEDAVVWGVLESKLDTLLADVERLLSSESS